MTLEVDISAFIVEPKLTMLPSTSKKRETMRIGMVDSNKDLHKREKKISYVGIEKLESSMVL